MISPSPASTMLMGTEVRQFLNYAVTSDLSALETRRKPADKGHHPAW